MSAGNFTLLWAKILDSSIWMESKETRLVWITMLAMKDADGVVRAAPKALAHRARVTEAECASALKTLREPDPQSSTPAHDGRRIADLEGGGGWQILNHELYRFSTDAKRAFWREQKAAQREAKKEPVGTPRKSSTASERLREKAVRNGDDQTVADLDRMEGQGVPRGKGLSPTPADPAAEAPALGAGTAHPPPCNPEAGRPDPQRSSSAEEEELTYPDGEPLG